MNLNRLFKPTFFLLSVSCALLMGSFASAENKAELDASIEDLKSEVVQLNRELFDLEEQLLYPATTSFAVYVSMDSAVEYDLDSILITLDEQPAASHVYTPAQGEALKRGGIQKLFVANIKPGLHNIKAEISGRDSDGRPMKRIVVADFGKARTSKYLEVKISGDSKKQRPEFAIVEWK